MLVKTNDPWAMSTSPHSISNQRDVTIPGWNDNDVFLKRQKAFQGKGMGDITDFLGEFNLQTVVIIGLGVWLIWALMFSEDKVKSRGERKLKSAEEAYKRRREAIKAKYRLQESRGESYKPRRSRRISQKELADYD